MRHSVDVGCVRGCVNQTRYLLWTSVSFHGKPTASSERPLCDNLFIALTDR
jgi:hypothetical protein